MPNQPKGLSRNPYISRPSPIPKQPAARPVSSDSNQSRALPYRRVSTEGTLPTHRSSFAPVASSGISATTVAAANPYSSSQRLPVKRKYRQTQPKSAAALQQRGVSSSYPISSTAHPYRTKQRTFGTAEAAAASVSPSASIQPKTALQLLREERQAKEEHPLHLLLPKLDWLSLGPGIFELAGPGGAGKTQLALTLCLQAAAATATTTTTATPGTSTTYGSIRAVYISLNTSKLSTVAWRLSQMAGDENAQILTRILTKACLTPEGLVELLRDQLPALHEQPRLLILDSVADIFRYMDGQDFAVRAAMLFDVSSLLKTLVAARQGGGATTPPLTVLVLNQVTADFSSSISNNTAAWSPALGLSWSHCVGTRFRLDRNSSSNLTFSASGGDRKLTLQQSSEYACPQETMVRISTAGCQIAESERNASLLVPKVER